MKNFFLKGTIFGIGFCLTVLTFIIGYAAWTNIATKSDGQSINAAAWNELVNNINSIGENYVPTGAIMAFNLSTCPTGWTEYTAARGRFLRGIDSSGTNDAIRSVGDIQTDSFQGHRHFMAGSSGGGNQATGYIGTYGPLIGGAYPTSDAITDSVNGTPRTANETRPKNVAVLYCIKQ